MTILPAADLSAPAPAGRRLVHRHALATRITHWINALCVTVLLMSGLQIFLAHPALYWGQSGADADRPAFEIGAETIGDGAQRGFVRLGSATLDTTGALGLVPNADGDLTARAFPRWATIPGWRSLTLGTALAFLLRLALRRQSDVLLPVRPDQRPSAPRSGADARPDCVCAQFSPTSSITCG